MNDQLELLDDENGDEDARAAWQIDEHTRDIGRRGVAQAREALRQAARRAA